MIDNAQRVKSSIKLSEYISTRYDVNLKGSSGKLRCACPLHGGDNDSAFTIDDDQGLWKCFSGECGGGSIIDFWMKENSTSDFSEALEGLSNEMGIELEKSRRSYRPSSKRVYQALAAVSKAACDLLYDHQDEQSQKAFEYANERGITDEIIDRYEIGFLPSGRDGIDFVMNACDDTEALVEGGVLLHKEEMNSYWCHLNGRLVFPIRNDRDRVVAFGGRRIEGIDSSGAGKYMNTSDTSVYNKSEVLYGMEKITKRTKHVIVVEGYLDVIGVSESLNGEEIVPVAACGTSLTQKHGEYLKQFKSVTEVFDGDQAGKKAVIRSLDLANQLGDSLQAVILDHDEDPWDLYRKGSSKLENIVFESLPIMSWAVRAQFDLLDNNEYDMTEWVRSIVPNLQYSRHREQIINDTAHIIGKQAYSFKQSLSLPIDFAKAKNKKKNDTDQISQSMKVFGSAIMKMSDEQREGVFASVKKWDEISCSAIENWMPVMTALDMKLVRRFVQGIDAPYSPEVDRAMASLYSDECAPDLTILIRGLSKQLLSVIGDMKRAPLSVAQQIKPLKRLSYIGQYTHLQPTIVAYLVDMSLEVERAMMQEQEAAV